MELSKSQQQRLREYVALADARHAASRAAAELVRELMDERRARVEEFARVDRWLARPPDTRGVNMDNEKRKLAAVQREIDTLDAELAEARAQQQASEATWSACGALVRKVLERAGIEGGGTPRELHRKLARNG